MQGNSEVGCSPAPGGTQVCTATDPNGTQQINVSDITLTASIFNLNSFYPTFETFTTPGGANNSTIILTDGDNDKDMWIINDTGTHGPFTTSVETQTDAKQNETIRSIDQTQPSGNMTLTCLPGPVSTYTCTASDENGIKEINVWNSTTGLKHVDVYNLNISTTSTTFSIKRTSVDLYYFLITDNNGIKETFLLNESGIYGSWVVTTTATPTPTVPGFSFLATFASLIALVLIKRINKNKENGK